MKEYVLIINKPEVRWHPPLHGNVTISVDQFLSRSNTHSIVHFCVDNCSRQTHCNDNISPAIFSFLCGKKVNLFKYFSKPENVPLTVNSPITFYFSDENNDKIRENTPIIRCKIIYE